MRFKTCTYKGPHDDCPFGFSFGQLRRDDFVHNGWWFIVHDDGSAGQIGAGDLSREDLTRIQANLLEGETWVIVREMAFCMHDDERSKLVARGMLRIEASDLPGLADVIITHDAIALSDDYRPSDDDYPKFTQEDALSLFA